MAAAGCSYKIKGGLDFYAELKQALAVQDPQSMPTDEQTPHGNGNGKDDNNTDDAPMCLLTMTPLTPGYITLQCRHTFNYVPLYTEVLTYMKHARKRGVYIGNNQIRCPYCRKLQDQLLPYVPYTGVKRVFRVNRPQMYCMPYTHKCTYGGVSASGGVSVETGCDKCPIYSEEYGVMMCPDHIKVHAKEERAREREAKAAKAAAAKEEQMRQKQEAKLKKAAATKVKSKSNPTAKKTVDDDAATHSSSIQV